MHEAVLSWVGQFRTDEDLAVLDIGGRDLNGNTRALFPNANPYHVIDIRPGKGVDIVADAADWRGNRGAYDLVLCTETFEHAERWREIILTAWEVLRPGGWLVFTCAGPGRPPHSGIEAVWGLIDGEHYANVSPQEIAAELTDQGWTEIEARLLGTDTQGKAVKPAVVEVAEVAEPREVTLSAALSRTAAPSAPVGS